MKQIELTNTFMRISNCEKPFDLYGLYKNLSAFQGLIESVDTIVTTYDIIL